MKICRFDDDRLGIVVDEHVLDVSEALDAIPPARWPLPAGDPLILNLEGVLARRGTAEWRSLLDAASVPAGPINDLAGVFTEPQVRHRGLRFDLPHPTAGRVPGVRNPVRFARTPIEYERAPPLLGADTMAELRDRLGIDESTLADLASRGIIA